MTHITLNIVKPISHSKTLPWKLLKPEIDTSFIELKKLKQNPLVFKQIKAEFKYSKHT